MKTTTKEQILKLSAEGMKPAKIARKVGCSYSYAYNTIAWEKKQGRPVTTVKFPSGSVIDLPLKEQEDVLRGIVARSTATNTVLSLIYGHVPVDVFVRVGAVLQSEERA